MLGTKEIAPEPPRGRALPGISCPGICGPALNLARVCVEASARAYREATFEGPLAQVLVVEESEPVIVAFRGSADVRAWLTDGEAGYAETRFGRVHEGFWKSMHSVLPEVLAGTRAAVILTGHSKGAAEALLAARLLMELGRPVGAVVTFGGPRIGDGNWRAGYNAALGGVTQRWVHEEDIVPRLPPWICGRRHVGHEYFMSSFGGVEIDPPVWRLAASDLWGTFWGYRQGRIEQVMDHPIGRYQDHINTL